MLFLKSTSGTIAFTDQAKAELTEYFSLAGVCLYSIKTHDDYLQARKEASPHFWEWIKSKTEDWPEDNEQYQLLKKALFE